jgi:hypothetical protein
VTEKFASVTRLNSQAAGNWRAAVGDLLAEENVRGVMVTVFYEDDTYKIRQLNVSQADIALIGARLIRLAAEDE